MISEGLSRNNSLLVLLTLDLPDVCLGSCCPRLGLSLCLATYHLDAEGGVITVFVCFQPMTDLVTYVPEEKKLSTRLLHVHVEVAHACMYVPLESLRTTGGDRLCRAYLSLDQ